MAERMARRVHPAVWIVAGIVVAGFATRLTDDPGLGVGIGLAFAISATFAGLPRS